MKDKKLKVLVGMSGGVDSSVAALLLVQAGYEVVGAFMKNWSDGEEGEECSWRKERRDAMKVAAKLDIPILTFDYENEYRESVYEYMIDEYKAGRTPNPDVLCNKYMKFGYLLKEAKKLNCDFIATGHYARIRRTPLNPPLSGGRPDEPPTSHGGIEGGDSVAHLLSGLDKNKDQSYFLCQLIQEQLKHILFPIGDMEKEHVRELALEHNLHVANKKDSQGICFVGKVKMVEFLKDRIPENPGKIITTSGEVIGEHIGHAYYTIGQRTGLGIGGGIPYFIVERRADTNEIVVAVGEDDPALLSSSLIAEQLIETAPGGLDKILVQPVKARIRYRQPLQDCVVRRIDNDKIDVGVGSSNPIVRVTFNKPQRAVAPGQFIAFYIEDELVASGVIDEAE